MRGVRLDKKPTGQSLNTRAKPSMARTKTTVRLRPLPPQRPEAIDSGMSDTNHIAMASPQDVDHGVTPSRSPSLSGFDERDHDSDLDVNFKSDMITPLPFLLKPLVGTAGTDIAPVSYPFNYNEASFPTGSVMR